jgi:hypothetical protein
MKLKLETVDMPEVKFRAFAEFLGWTPTVMTEDLSPNVPIDNPQTFVSFLEARYGSPIRNDVARFRAQVAEAEANYARAALEETLAAARETERAAAAQIVSFAADGE